MQYGLVGLWWLVFAALLLVGVPLAARLYPGAPERSVAVALPLALVALLLGTYWVGQLAFGPPAVALVALALVGLSAYAASREGFSFPRRRYAESLVVFTLAFGLLLAIRAVDAGAVPGAGEKFLDFGLLQALLRAPALPPEDFWFAGHHVVYYYGGHLLAATLATLTDTAGRYAYNLALAGVYATEVTAAFGLARNLATDRGYPARAAGALAAVCFGLASNLLTPVRLLAGLLPEPWTAALADALGRTVAEATVTPETFTYWTASRAMHDADTVYITEFPFFSYLNGDLHAHMVAVLVTFLVAGVCEAYWRTDDVGHRRRLLCVLGACVGAVTLVNTWSLATATGLVALTVALAPASPRTLLPARLRSALGARRGGPAALDGRASRRSRLSEEGTRFALGVAVAVGVALLGLLLVAPFVDNVLLSGVSGRSPALLPDRSPLGGFLVVHGAFLLVLGSYLAGRTALTPRRVGALCALAVALLVAGWRLDLVGLALAGPLVLAGWYLLRARPDRVGFETVLVVAGAGLVLLVEFAYLQDSAAAGRLNTVFKAYFSAWAFWSVAGGVALASLLTRARTWLPVSRDDRRVVGAACVVLLVATLVLPYAGLALTDQFAGASDPTLDAIEYAHTDHPEQAAAIEWLANESGTPTIVERPGRTAYAWRNPASSLTGVPTVVGWVHESIYRGGEAYATRANDVDAIYTTTETTSRHLLLEKYDVEYVWVGALERERYGNVTARFANDPALSVAYENDGVTVYAVAENAST
ncbi:hypothetical protein EFA46_010600 (plasmid) [Halarchaeum sp. CBA1220]|uniref:DUF2298 domain-containing protein n=1 Tax=Halarchaeum sp. CBA1220 TaxID=1853682 RepID=UPI000F3A8D07|nr:DUF2298 domain-containing protein [Halarchaeum sp. CBA1220]QLC34710.1 hypothetical protein EFA46_010600 [Halarchaeum sp. CBA1220]